MVDEKPLAECDVHRSDPPACWVCGARTLRLIKVANLSAQPSAAAFQITDAHYGRTADIYECEACGFRQCPTLNDVLSYYAEMDDGEYEATRAARATQARRLLDIVSHHKPHGRLLDVGAASGILVQEAQVLGYDAEGIEPSKPLQARAQAQGLPVHEGVLPHPKTKGPYDVVTMVDVIEHVADPIGLLSQVERIIADDGVCAIVTPDVQSVAARLMGRHWWHYRLAHLGYFDRRTLARAIRAAGLEPVKLRRPFWYFPADYLAERALSYLPERLRPPVPSILKRVVMPLNLFDSLLVICRKA